MPVNSSELPVYHSQMQQQNNPYASTGASVMHTHNMVPHMSTAGMGMLHSPATGGMTMGMQSNVGTHGIMQQGGMLQGMQQTNMAMHQANMGGLHHQTS